MRSISIIAVAVFASISAPAMAQSQAPATGARTEMSQTPEEYMASENAFRATVTADTVIDAVSKARRQCRAWVDSHPNVDLKAARHAIFRSTVMKALTAALYSQYAAYAPMQPELDQRAIEARASINCQRLLKPSNVTEAKAE